MLLSKRALGFALLLTATVSPFAHRLWAQAREATVKTDHLQMKYYATSDVVHPDARISLVADFLLLPKMHVYTPDVKTYIPIDFKVEASPNYKALPATYPKGKLMMLPAINEIVPVYEGQFRITQDVVVGAANLLQPLIASGQPLKIRGTLRYQACDDKICYLPQTIPLEWTFKVEGLTPAPRPAPAR
jgi:hypothetical protein